MPVLSTRISVGGASALPIRCAALFALGFLFCIGCQRTDHNEHGGISGQGAATWHEKLQEQLLLLGHRNIVLVADSAFPLQSSEGITTLYADAAQLDVLSRVLSMLLDAEHVRPNVYLDAELAIVSEDSAPGIEEYRSDLDSRLANLPVNRVEHMELIKRLDNAADLFHVIIVKTSSTLPYSSVCFELDCNYWDAEREAQLRSQMETQAAPSGQISGNDRQDDEEEEPADE